MAPFAQGGDGGVAADYAVQDVFGVFV